MDTLNKEYLCHSGRRRRDSNPGELLHPTSLAVRRFRPLSHVSVYSDNNKKPTVRKTKRAEHYARPFPTLPAGVRLLVAREELV